MKKRSFLSGAFILAGAGIISKFIGFFFRVPLTNMIGAKGYGLYNYPYNLYSAMLAISITGLPVAISKLVSEKIAIDRYDEAHRIFKVSLIIMLFLGSFTSLFLFFSSKFLVSRLWPPGAYYPLMGLVLAPLFVSLMSAFRGYFQGMQIMIAHSISQVFESFGRLIFGLGLAYTLYDKGLEYAAGGASFGATAGAFIGLMVIGLFYLKMRAQIFQNINKYSNNKKAEPISNVVKTILSISIPISIGALAGTLMPMIDSLMIKSRLAVAGFSEELSTILFGRLGAGTTLINFPLTISIAIAVSIVPAISEANAQGMLSEIKKRLELGIKMGLYLVLPASIGLFVLAEPILNCIFPKISEAHNILKLLAISLFFMTLNQVLTASIQGLGKVMIPVKNLFIGAIVKIATSYYIISIPEYNIKGAAIGTIIGYFIAASLNYSYLKRHINFKLNKLDTVIKPILASCIMGITVVYFYEYSFSIFSSNSISTLVSIGLGAIIYGLILIITGGIRYMDIVNIVNRKGS